MRRDQSQGDDGCFTHSVSGPPAWARSTPGSAGTVWARQDLGPWPLADQPLSLCPQTDTSDPEKVVSAFLKVSSVFKDEAAVRTAVQDAVGNVGCGTWVALPLRCSRHGAFPVTWIPLQH